MKFWPWRQSSADGMTDAEIYQKYGHGLVIPIPQSLEWVSQYVMEAMPLELASLDRKIRENSAYLSPNPLWPQISTNELERILRSPDSPVAFLGLVSFHPSGYIRELAVQRLSAINTGLEVPFLVLRLNDWVAPVYQLALAAFQTRVLPKYADALVRNLSLLFELEKQERRTNGSLLTSVITLLKKPECDAALQKGMNAPEKKMRRLCFQILAEANDARLPLSIPLRITDSDMVIRLSAARIARTRLDEGVLRALLPTLRLDNFMPVRREALCACLERMPDLAPAVLRTALLDRSAGIREIARHRLRQSGDFPFSEFYRQALAHSSSPLELITALSGLGETGVVEDTALVLPYLAHSLAKVRRSAIRSLSKLDKEDQIDTLLTALTDERPSVTHEARKALSSRLAFVNTGELWRIFQAEAYLHIRFDALALLAMLPKWESIPLLVMAAAESEPQVRQHVEKHMRDWSAAYNDSFVKPTPVQLARLGESLRINPNDNLTAIVNDWKEKGVV